MKGIVFLCIILPHLIFSQGSFQPLDADLSFPRSIIDRNDIVSVRESLHDEGKLEIYSTIYNYAQHSIPNDNTSIIDRRFRAQIAREAAFIILMNLKVVGSELVPLESEERSILVQKTIKILSEINAEVGFQAGWSFYYSWQFRSKELIHLLIAYDLLKGAGIEDNLLELGRLRLQNFAGNLFHRSISLYPSPIAGFPDIDFYFYNPNNHGVMVSSALGLAGIVLSDCESDNANYQPINWINAGMWNLDNLLWRVDGLIPRVSDDNKIAGYAEGPNYFNYGFQNAFPFIRAMWNYLPESGRTYSFKNIDREIENPWYDQNYQNIYHWMLLIRMPDGRSPAIHDSNANFATNFTALSGNPAYNIPSTKGNYDDIWTRSQYLSTNVEQSEFQESLFQALPDAGNLIFRSAYSDPAGIYMHLIGKHDIALNGAKAHHQADAMSFQLYYDGHIFAIDEGYGGANYRQFVNKATDHNLILVDGKGPTAPLSEWVNADNEVYIENYFDLDQLDYGELTGAWQGALLKRNTLFVDTSYFIMWDLVESATPKTFQFQLHASGLEHNTPDHTTGNLTFLPEDHRIVLNKGESHVLVQTEVTSKNSTYMLTLDSMYNGTTMQYHNKLLVGTTPQTQTYFTSLMVPFSESPPNVQNLDTSSGTTALIVDRQNSKDLILTQTGGLVNNLEFEPTKIIRTNASTVYLSVQNDNKVQSVHVGSGDTLYFNDRQLFQSDQKVNFTLQYQNTQHIKGYISQAATVRIYSDTSMLPIHGPIAHTFYDPNAKELVLQFESAGYFELKPGEAIISSTVALASSSNLQLKCFPNPTSGITSLQIGGLNKEVPVLKIFSFNGELLKTELIQNQTESIIRPIDLTSFPIGIYTIQVQQGAQIRALLIEKI